jgi:hypothetical protein
MTIINEVTVIIRKRSFPSFIDEIYKRGLDLVDMQRIEETGDGVRYILAIAATGVKRFDEFITLIGGASEKYKIVAVKNVLEERTAGGLLNVAGRMPIETLADYSSWVLGAAGFVQEKIRAGEGAAYTGIGRSVGLIAGIKAGSETEHERLLSGHAEAERDAVIINRFAGLNAFPICVRYDHPEDVIKLMKQIERNFAALRVTRFEDATLMLYERLFADTAVPVVSLEHDDLPLYLFVLIIKILLKYRLKPEESTIGFVGIDLSAIRLTGLLGAIRFRRILGADRSEKAMLALENQGGLATTAENIFSNADITILLKAGFTREELLKIRPGQFVISLLEDADPDVIAATGVREFITRSAVDLAVLFPGMLKGIIGSGRNFVSDQNLIEYSRKLVSFLSDSFEFPPMFSDIHDRVADIMKSGVGRE